MAFTQTNAIEVRRTRGKGRGVFAVRPIRAGDVIERVPVLVMPLRDLADDDRRAGLLDYCFVWGRDTVALALGYGSLYNHSYSPNARYDDENLQTKVFTALRDIEPGEEITINYNGEPTDKTSVGFEVLEASLTPAPRTARTKRASVLRNGSAH
jgi:SET domain-containing protein